MASGLVSMRMRNCRSASRRKRICSSRSFRCSDSSGGAGSIRADEESGHGESAGHHTSIRPADPGTQSTGLNSTRSECPSPEPVPVADRRLPADSRRAAPWRRSGTCRARRRQQDGNQVKKSHRGVGQHPIAPGDQRDHRLASAQTVIRLDSAYARKLSSRVMLNGDLGYHRNVASSERAGGYLSDCFPVRRWPGRRVLWRCAWCELVALRWINASDHDGTGAAAGGSMVASQAIPKQSVCSASGAHRARLAARRDCRRRRPLLPASRHRLAGGPEGGRPGHGSRASWGAAVPPSRSNW